MNATRLKLTSIGVTLLTVLGLITSAVPASAITDITPVPAGPYVFEVGDAITDIVFTETGANGTTTYSVSPALPAGLSLNTADGTISGTPTAATAQSVYVVTVADAGNSTSSPEILDITVTNDPTVSTSAASDIAGISATLNATVTAGHASTLIRFCISPNANLLGCSYVTATQSPLTGNTPTNVSATATGLTPSTQYFFRVEAQNTASAPSWVEGSTLNFTTLAQSAPGVPQNLTAEAVAAGSIELDWDQPASNGGSAVTDYVIQQSTNGTDWNTITDGVSTATGYTVTGLTASQQYYFRVAAKNIIGTGSYTSATAALFPRTVPGAPTGVTGVSGSTAVLLSWTAPASTGGSAITDYVIQRSTNGTDWTTVTDSTSTNTSLTISDLTNGQSYVFRVAAVNIVGAGAYSANSAAIVVGAPGAPTNLIGTVGNTQVRLDWNAPALTGGVNISDYVIQFSSNAGTSWTTFNDGTSTASETTVTGLTNGTSYVFRVAAVNSRGQGAFSTTSAAVVPAPNPPTVTNVSPVAGPLAGGTTVTITGTNLTGATVTFGGTAGTNVVVNATGTSLTVVTPARPAGAVSVVVNTLGGTITSTTTFTYVTAPTAPATVGAVAGINSALVSWSAVTGATSYTVTSNPAGGTCTVTGTTANCTNLVAGANYTFTVIAVNAGGNSPVSVASNVVAPKPPTVTKTRKITVNFSGSSLTIPAVKIAAIRTAAAQITVDEGTQVRIAVTGFTKQTGATAAELALALTRAKAVRKVARSYGLAGTYTVTNTGKAKTVARAQKVVMTITWVTQAR